MALDAAASDFLDWYWKRLGSSFVGGRIAQCLPQAVCPSYGCGHRFTVPMFKHGVIVLFVQIDTITRKNP